MRFSKNLYCSPRIRDPQQIKRDLWRGRGHLTIYVLTLSRTSKGKPVLEIMHCANFQQPYYREHPPLVVGFAEGRQDAFELVRSIAQEAFDRTGQWDAAAYLQSVPGNYALLCEKGKPGKEKHERIKIERGNPLKGFFAKGNPAHGKPGKEKSEGDPFERDPSERDPSERNHSGKDPSERGNPSAGNRAKGFLKKVFGKNNQ